jgi:hypothetical protein
VAYVYVQVITGVRGRDGSWAWCLARREVEAVEGKQVYTWPSAVNMVGNPLGHKKEYSAFAGFEEAEIVNSGEVQASEVGSGGGSACCRGCARVWAGPPCLPGMTWGQVR